MAREIDASGTPGPGVSGASGAAGRGRVAASIEDVGGPEGMSNESRLIEEKLLCVVGSRGDTSFGRAIITVEDLTGGDGGSRAELLLVLTLEW